MSGCFPFLSVEEPREKKEEEEEEDTTPKEPETVKLLVEVVGAMGVDPRNRVDTYVVVLKREQKLTTEMVSSLQPTITSTPSRRAKMVEKELHRTAIVTNNGNPIWTARSKSLFLVDVPKTLVEKVEKEDDVTSDAAHNESEQLIRTEDDFAKSKKLLIPEWSLRLELRGASGVAGLGDRVLGTVTLSPEDDLRPMIQSNSARWEYNLHAPALSSRLFFSSTRKRSVEPEHVGILAIRVREATRDDLDFMANRGETLEEKFREDQDTGKKPIYLRGLATDMDFKEVQPKNLFMSYHKTVTYVDKTESDPKKQKKKLEFTRVLPGPDPDRPVDATEWMTDSQIQAEALKPSTKWIHAGYGSTGRIYLEILGCDGLPRMDATVVDSAIRRDAKTGTSCDADPFVAVCFEDNFVRTDVLWDKTNPRYMPWSMRAFCFHARRRPPAAAASLIMLGVFDYDVASMDLHDAIGRVVINTSHFEPNVEYLLHYKLQHDPHDQVEGKDANRGNITLRLRLEWDPLTKEQLRQLQPPGSFIINTKSSKSYGLLKYLTRGPIDMESSTVETVFLYVTEMISYWYRYCHFLDILFEVLLWRGRWYVAGRPSGWSIWFPIHSVVLSTSAFLALEYPAFAPPIVLHLIAWILLSINSRRSNHPNPWKRVKPSPLLGHGILRPSRATRIEAHDGDIFAKSSFLDKLDDARGKRMSRLIESFLYFLLRIYSIYSTTSVGAKFFSSSSGSFSWNVASSLINRRLTYLHMMLKLMCKYARLYLSIINWEDWYSSNKIVVGCMTLGTLWAMSLFFVGNVAFWVFRFVAWLFLGPWMKLVDMAFVHRWYRTSDELLYDIVSESRAERAKESDAIDTEDGKQMETNNDGLSQMDNKEKDLPDFDAILSSETFLKMSHQGRVVGEDAIKLRDMRVCRFGRYSEFIPMADSSRFPSIPLPASSATPFDGQLSATSHHEYHVPGQKLEGRMIMTRSQRNLGRTIGEDFGTLSGEEMD